MSYKRTNNITGWIICIIACAVYIMTMEATGSFWDCGEFASSAYKLQIPHPPGAPLFVLIGRLFMAPFDPKHAATGINLMSALASGFTILFLFWTITHFARKIVIRDGAELTREKIFGIMAAGAVGALAYTFSDSFWYSAVEGEVYAMSSFFTGIVFWTMVKWEQSVDEEHSRGITGHFTRADRWIILLFYLMGLSIGVHLLNLLTIPAIVMMYYFKRYKPSTWGTVIAFIVGCFVTGIVQKAVIVWTIKGAGNFDIFFKNSVGMPFFIGFIIYFLILAGFIYYGLKLRPDKFDKTKLGIWLGLFLLVIFFLSGSDSLMLKIFLYLLLLAGGIFLTTPETLARLKLFIWSFAFMLLGYSPYATTMVRSLADPAVDMYNVDNPVSLVGYLSRDQYGDWPIIYGQDFTADVKRDDTGYPDMNDDGPTYIKGKNKYVVGGEKQSYQYNSEDMHFFPRMWDQSNDQGHADYYRAWMGLDRDKQGQWVDRKPTMGENIAFFMQYQVGWMYLRYFMWNFAGKQNDVQGVEMSNIRDGNWISGISFIDNWRLGDQSLMPDSLKKNKANNKLYLLPLILGILGLIYHVMKDKRDALVIGLLFFFTGFAIVLYLNQAGNQPRERDYAYVGSFYAFAIWIGIGVLYIKDLLAGFVKNRMAAIGIASAICLLAVPVLMASQEWDDHDRSKKTLARDLAIDYLESCAPNAILVSFGDNDTYPLWYAQEVEGIRRDIRVINSSLLGTDWYINQLRYKVNESAPADMILTEEQIQGSKRDQIMFNQKSGLADKPMDLYSMIKNYIGSDDKDKTMQERGDLVLNTFPTKKVTIPVDQNLVRQNGIVNASDSVVSEVSFEIPKNYIFKNDLAILSLLAGSKWQRPIYFTSPEAGDLGFKEYLRMDGLSYRFVPVKNADISADSLIGKMMNKFAFGNCNIAGVYYDEENRRHLNTIRMAYAQAGGALADQNRKEDAKRLLEKCDKMMLQENFPYGMVSRRQQHDQISMQMLIAAYKAGDSSLALKINNSVKRDLEQQLAYYQGLDEDKRGAMAYDEEMCQRFLTGLGQLERQFKNPITSVNPNEQLKPIHNQPGGDSPRRDTQKAKKTP